MIPIPELMQELRTMNLKEICEMFENLKQSNPHAYAAFCTHIEVIKNKRIEKDDEE